MRVDTELLQKEDEELANVIGNTKKEKNKSDFLPLDEFLEFMNDLTDVLTKHQGVLLAKISELYAQNTISS